MSTAIPQVVEEYLRLVEGGEPKACKETAALAARIRQVFDAEDLTIDERQLDKYLSLVKYWLYDGLMPWEKFLIALWDCTC